MRLRKTFLLIKNLVRLFTKDNRVLKFILIFIREKNEKIQGFNSEKEKLISILK